jgi:hypothetical protein
LAGVPKPQLRSWLSVMQCMPLSVIATFTHVPLLSFEAEA